MIKGEMIRKYTLARTITSYLSRVWFSCWRKYSMKREACISPKVPVLFKTLHDWSSKLVRCLQIKIMFLVLKTFFHSGRTRMAARKEAGLRMQRAPLSFMHSHNRSMEIHLKWTPKMPLAILSLWTKTWSDGIMPMRKPHTTAWMPLLLPSTFSLTSKQH